MQHIVNHVQMFFTSIQNSQKVFEMRNTTFKAIVLAPILWAGGKPSTWFPPGGCRANTATERKRTNRRTNQQTKNQQKIWQITQHIAILFGGLRLGGSVAWWLRGSVAWWFSGSSFGAFVIRRLNDTWQSLHDLAAALGSVGRPHFDRVRCLAECLWSSIWYTEPGNCFSALIMIDVYDSMSYKCANCAFFRFSV